jgi:hypothetical protein
LFFKIAAHGTIARMNLEHNATITLDTTAADEATAERILDGLRGHSPAIGWLPDGRMDVTVTVAGEGLVDAASTAMSAVERASGRRAVSVEVMTTAEFDARHLVGGMAD